ncbi:YvcK family protein [Candidatus Woesearchaeota archaeon]|nr:YvcK family protein [Candidatus Woesearchaeota archaeon]
MGGIVVIGGGTGSFTVLKGLKRYTNDLTAIVSMFDSGGSTGKLRDELGYLPTGDVRRCILALAPEDSNTDLLRSLMSYRFEAGKGLNGHSMGNLLLTALKEITGDEVLAIERLSKLLGLKGKVLPVTIDNSQLNAVLENGEIIRGETNIDIPKHDGKLRINKVFIHPPANALIDAIDAIRNAEKIVIGPGDLFTSIIPNFLVKGIPEAIKESKAKKIFVCNVMTKHGETNNFKASDFLKALETYLGENSIEIMLCNTELGNQDLLKKYSEENAFPVEIDFENLSKVKLVTEDLLNNSEIIRHDSMKLAKVILDL